MALIFKSFIYWPFAALKLYSSRKVSTIAAAASFYLILTLVPLSLLLTKVVGQAIGDLEQVKQWLFGFGGYFLPEASQVILQRFQLFLDGPLLKSKSFTFFNFIFLFFSGMSFINTIYNGLYLMSRDAQYFSLWRYLRAIILLTASLVFLTVILLLDPLMILIVDFIRDNYLTSFLTQYFPQISIWLNYLIHIEESRAYWLKSSLFYFFILGLYFSFVYRWFFNWAISFKRTLMASGVFIFLLLIGKNLFWIYLKYGREALVESYGDFYTIILALFWIYLVMSFFYYGACFCVVEPYLVQKNSDRPSDLPGEV